MRTNRLAPSWLLPLILVIASACVAVEGRAQNDSPEGTRPPADPGEPATDDGAADVGAASETAPVDATDDVVVLDASDLPPASEDACFNIWDVRSFHAFSNRYIYVESRRRDDHYLLTMFSACPGLRGSIGIDFSSSINRVCSNSLARLRFRAFGRIEECVVSRVEAVESREDAEEIAQQRMQAR